MMKKIDAGIQKCHPHRYGFHRHDLALVIALSSRHSGAMPTGPRETRPDDRLRIEPGIQGFPDAQLRI
jgi:hypothetical protein